jgi:tetratricopeptide (TPR) repeat protein
VTTIRVGALAAVLVLGTLAARAVHAQGGGELSRLEERSRAFYAMVERGDKEKAAAVWPDLVRDLDAYVNNMQNRLDALQDEVSDAEGDVAALYNSARWREPQVATLVATYHLAWVRYQAAQLTGDAAKKKDLLRQAASGFSQFLLVNEVPEIYAESLYGRGLAFMDLGDYKRAIEDLTAAVEEGRVSAKARPALEEARRRAAGKKPGEPAADDPEALVAKLGDLLPRADGEASQKDATTLARGLAARGGPWPVRVAGVVSDKLGDAAHPRSSFGLYLLAQLAVDRGRCGDVAPFAAAGTELKDPGRDRWRPELLFLDAGCRLNARQSRDAAEHFAVLLAEYPGSRHAVDAAYYRARALDVARTEDPALTATYEDSLRTFLARNPRSEQAGEIHWMLAELFRSRGDCTEAIEEYGRVGAGKFASRARLGALECRAAAVAAAGKTDAGGRTEDRRAVVDALAAFVAQTPAKGPDEALAARGALLAAALAASATPPDQARVATLLDGFERRFPEARTLHPRALELRVAARVATGDLGGADVDVDAVLALPADDEVRKRVLPRLARDLNVRAERGGADAAPALALARKVFGALAATGDPGAQIALAGLTLRAGDAAEARRLYEAALVGDPTSSEALRGAARAAASAGDRPAALARWRQILDASPPGGTAWYEARIAQVELLASDGRRDQACEILRQSRGRATTAGADQLEARLRSLEPTVCQ